VKGVNDCGTPSALAMPTTTSPLQLAIDLTPNFTWAYGNLGLALGLLRT
jgi:hypothetical protein